MYLKINLNDFKRPVNKKVTITSNKKSPLIRDAGLRGGTKLFLNSNN